MAKLELKNICLSYASNLVLSNVSLLADDGEFVVLVGPSGSGKSTILRAIAGLESPSSGDILLDGKKIIDLHPKDRDIAMVFQNYALYPHLTVYENIAFPLLMRKTPENQIKKSVEDISELLGISTYLSKKPKELSGGERQRVALGRAIVRKPKLFLMDEPLSNLDAKLRSHMRTELLKLQKSLNATFVYVTHDQVEALTMGDRIAVLNKGMIQQYDTPVNIYTSPANTFVAGFIGSPPMNFFQIEVVSQNKVTLDSKEYSFTFDDKTFSNIKKLGKYIFGVRPETILLSKDEGKLSVPVEIDLVEMLGFEYIVHFSSNNKSYCMRTQCKPNESSSNQFISFDLNIAHVYDFNTGDLIT